MKRFTSLVLLTVVCVLAICAQTCWAWTVPVPLSELNTDMHDKAPFLSSDALTLYFAREGTDGDSPAQLYSATRTEPSIAFTNVQRIDGLAYSGHVSSPWVSSDNLRMYYYRTEGSNRRLKMAERQAITDEWQHGADIDELNAMGMVATPFLTPDELTLFFSGYDLNGGHGGYDIWMADRPDRSSPFGEVTNIGMANGPAWDAHPCVSSDGLTVYFSSNRNGSWQLFKVTRESKSDQFDGLEHLSFFDCPGSNLQYPSLTADGGALFFANMLDGAPFDIYVSYIPEPGTLFLLGLGSLVMAARRGAKGG